MYDCILYHYFLLFYQQFFNLIFLNLQNKFFLTILFHSNENVSICQKQDYVFLIGDKNSVNKQNFEILDILQKKLATAQSDTFSTFAVSNQMLFRFEPLLDFLLSLSHKHTHTHACK